MKSLFSDIRWAKIQEPREGGVLDSFLFENEYGRLIYRYVKKKAGIVNGVQYYDIASYRGVAGPLIEQVSPGKEEEFVRAFNKKFDEYCADKKIIAEFAKIDPWNEYHRFIEKGCGAEHYGNFYCNFLDEDFYEKRYNRNATRAIRKAENGGVKVQIDMTGETINDFVRLYRNTENKYHTGDYYNFEYEDIKEYFDVFGKDAFLINAVLNGEVITAVLVVCGVDIVHYYLLGNNPEYFKLQCNSLLTYHAALYGQKLGKKVFDMGGGKPGGNIELFKMNFTGEAGVIKYYAIKKIRNKSVYDTLVMKKNEIKNEHFFPLYRG